MPTVIYINGASSAGKTTLAREIQERRETPIHYYSIDPLIETMPAVDLAALRATSRMGRRLTGATVNHESPFLS